MLELIVQVVCVAAAALLIYYKLGKIVKELADVFLTLGNALQNGEVDADEREAIWKEIEELKQAIEDRGKTEE